MTNITNSNLGWEVAGGKKNNTVKKVDQDGANKLIANGNGKVGSKELASKIPKLENLPPLKPDSTIYDLIRDDDDDSDSDNKSRLKTLRPKKPVVDSTAAAKANNVSPKQRKAPQQEPINLLASSVMSNQKKKTPSSPSAHLGKSGASEFDMTLSNLKVEEFEKEHANLVALFSNNLLLINEHMATYLNSKLNQIAEFENNVYHEKELSYPTTKLEKKVSKFLSTHIAKLNRNESERLFEFCFGELFNESSKQVSFHGYKIYIQLLTKQMPHIIMNNLDKYVEVINANKHRHQRCLIALWSLGQAGCGNISNAVRIWFECMLPFVNTKNCNNLITSYLPNIFDQHKVDEKSVRQLNNSKELFTLDQYIRFFDLVNERATLNIQKDIAIRFKSSHGIVRSLFVQELANNGTNYLESLLQGINNEKTIKQVELIDLLTQVLATNKDALAKWKQIYSKYLSQTINVLEHLSENNCTKLKSIKEINKFLYHVDEQTSLKLKQTTSSSTAKETSGKQFYRKSQKSSSPLAEMDLTRKLNGLTKTLIKRHFEKRSLIGTMLRTLVIVAAAVGLFFYWDVNQNKSLYVNSISKELAKYGLLDPTVKFIATVRNLIANITKQLNYYVPIYYKKISETVVPVSKTIYSSGKEYLTLIWVNSEPYRITAYTYYQHSVEYIEQNFPVFVKNLISVIELAINYATTILNFAAHYFQIALDFVGIQLLGWNKGDLEKIFFDAFKYFLEYLTQLLQKVNNALAQN